MKIKNFENYRLLPCGTVIGARGKPLKPDLNSCGYKRVSLSKEGNVTRRFVHQIVAEHYHKKPKHKCVVNHIDGDKSNNHFENLEWVTPSQNVKDGFNRGRVAHNKYSKGFIFTLKCLYQNGHTIKSLARLFNKDRNAIARHVKA